MGIHVMYGGVLNDMAQLDTFIEDMQQYCQRIGWPCDIKDEMVIGGAAVMAGYHEDDCRIEYRDIHERLRGVIIRPPGTNGLHLTFNEEGRMIRYYPAPQVYVLGITNQHFEPDEDEDAPMQIDGWYTAQELVATTVTGAPQSHLLMIPLLRYVHENYISNLVVHDSTNLWESTDLELFDEIHGDAARAIGLLRGIAEAAGASKENIRVNSNFEKKESLLGTPDFVKESGMGKYYN